MAQTGIPSTYTGPGLVDLQLNGFAGFDFNSQPEDWTAEQLFRVRDALRACGVVHALPTLITDDVERIMARAAAYRRLVEAHPQLQTAFPGLHIEGPFISPEDGPRGAHPLSHCKLPEALPDFLEAIISASGGRVKLITVAPELEGALPFIPQCRSEDIVVGIGHTNASAVELKQAVSAGARIATHLGNGSHQMLPRLENYVQHQLADDRLYASFIADGHHVPYPTLKNFLRAKGFTRSILVTDAIAAAGKGSGRFQLGSQEVIVDDQLRCQIEGQPNLAGSALTLDRAVLNVARYCDVPFEEAWTMASLRPAKLIGLDVPELVMVSLDAGY